MQRAGAGEAHFIETGRDRRLDIFAASGAGIPLPFTPSRNHRGILATAEITTIFIKSSSPRAAFPLESECLTAKKQRRKSLWNQLIVYAWSGHRHSVPSTANCGGV